MLTEKFAALDPDARFFFVHVPKTGGTSLFSWLSGIYGEENCRHHVEEMLLPHPTPEVLDQLRDLNVVSGHIPVDWCYYFGGFGFTPITIVRNPVDQFHSNVNHLLTRHSDGESVGDLLVGIRAKLSVSTGHFLENAETHELAFFDNPQSRTVFGGNFAWRDCNEAERAAWLAQTYSAIMLTETMNNELAARVFPEGSTVPHENVNPSARETLTPRQKGLLRDLIGKDVALYRTVFEMSLDV